MRFRSLAIALAVAALIGYAASTGCGKSSSSTSPGPGTVSETFASGNLTAGVPFSHTFANAGTYAYRCTNHSTSLTSGMVATVTVDGASSVMLDSVLVGSGGNFFVPGNITIAPSGTVKWKLVTGLHNVSRP